VVELRRAEVGGLSGVLVFVGRCATWGVARTGTVVAWQNYLAVANHATMHHCLENKIVEEAWELAISVEA